MTLRVIVAEDNALMREGIASVLKLHDDIDLVSTCRDYDELIEGVDAYTPDVVVTDIRMPPTQTDEGIRAAKAFRHTHPDTGVVVLSQYVEPGYAMRLLSEGSEGARHQPPSSRGPHLPGGSEQEWCQHHRKGWRARWRMALANRMIQQ